MDNLYHYQRFPSKTSKAVSLYDAVDKAIIDFHEKYGYYPSILTVRADECNGKGFPLEVMKVSKDLPTSHFKLGLVIKKRKPRVLNVKRKPCQIK